MERLTKEQAAVLSAHTGVLCGKFADLHEYVEQILERPVMTHEMGSQAVADKIREASRSDFMQLVAIGESA